MWLNRVGVYGMSEKIVPQQPLGGSSPNLISRSITIRNLSCYWNSPTARKAKSYINYIRPQAKIQKIIFHNLWISGVFWSFCGFWRYFGYFLGFGGILVIFRFRRYFGPFLGFGGILIIFRFWGYFGHF